MTIESDIQTRITETPRELYIEQVLYTKIDQVHPFVLTEDKSSKKSNNDCQIFPIGEYDIKFKSSKKITQGNSQLTIYRIDRHASRIIQDKNIYSYFLYIVNSESLDCDLVSILEADILQKQVIELFSDKSVKLSVKSLGLLDGSRENYQITLDVYLTNKLNNENLAEFPSDFYRNVNAHAVNNVMNCVYFSKRSESELKILSDRFDCDNDDLYNKCLEKKGCDYKTSQEILFEMVHNLNNKFNVVTEKDIDAIQEGSCLKPKLRKYQINAIKWMLGKENFDFKSLDMHSSSSAVSKYKKLKKIHV